MIIETCPKCGGDLLNIVYTSYPPIPAKRCVKCGWEWRGKPDPIERVPFVSSEAVNDKL